MWKIKMIRSLRAVKIRFFVKGEILVFHQYLYNMIQLHMGLLTFVTCNHVTCFFNKTCLVYCWFSLSHHHQSHSTNKVKNQRDKKRWIFKQSRKDSGQWNVSCRRYSKKSFTQIYKALYGDVMFVPHWGAQIWLPEANKNIGHRVLL